ncbi:MAG: NFACT family protein, partial [Halalkalicoccus sp.]
MDRKRELTSIDLAALVGELNEYEGAKVDKAYLYGDDFLRLKLRDFERGRVELLIEVGDVKRAHVAAPEHVPDAPGRPPDFAKMLRNRLSGADFAGVSQYEFDRILSFEFEREDVSTTIIAELFGEGNVAACDETRHVIDSLETVRLKSRTVAPGSRYQFPDSRVNPLQVSEEAFVAHMRESDSDLVRTLATQLNLGGLYAEEVCTRAGVEKTVAIDEAEKEQLERLYDALSRLAAEVTEKRFDPRIYRDDEGALVDVT